MVRFDNDPPCNFLAYLEWRLGKDEDATTRLLGEWLATYEPKGHAARPETPHNARRPDLA